MLLFLDAFSKKALIPTSSPRSEFAAKLVTSRPKDAFIDLIANSSRSDDVINSSQNCILYPVFNCINNVAQFPRFSYSP